MAYGLQEARELVLEAGHELVQRGLIARTWGNISARISGEQFVITPSGRSYDTLSPEDIVVVNIRDMSFEGNIRPSSEKGVHTAIYRERADADFIIHTHQAYASALSIMGRNIDIVARDGSAGVLPCSLYGRNGSPEIMEHMRMAVASHPGCNAFLMQHHGAVCFGKSREEAFDRCTRLELESRAYFRKVCGEDLPDVPFGVTCAKPEGDFGANRDLSGSALIPAGKRAVLARTPYILLLSGAGRSMPAYIDDLAQIAGAEIPAVADTTEDAEVRQKLSLCPALFVRGRGAICTGESDEEVEALCMVLEKNCLAAYLAEKTGAEPVDPADAAWDREAYVKSYAKLIKTNV